MKTIYVYKAMIASILFGMCISYTFADEEKNEMMRVYGEDLTKYIIEAQNDLRDTEKIFAEEKDEFLENTDFNQRIIELKQQKLAVMKELLKAVHKQDFDMIEKLERQQEINQHRLNLIGTEKDMVLTLGKLKKRAEYEKVADPAKLKASIKELESLFYGILASEEAVFTETLRLKSLYKDKEKKLAECEDIFQSDKKE